MILKTESLKTALFRAWRFFSHCTTTFAAHHLSAYAAQMTFYLVLAAFPLLMLLCMVTRLLPVSADTMQNALAVLLPSHLRTLAVTITEGYFNENIGRMSLWLVFFLIWSCSRLMLSLMNALSTIGGIQETRGQLRLRLIGCGYTVVLCILLAAALAMVGFGERSLAHIARYTDASAVSELLLPVIRDLLSPCLLLVIFWCSYVFLPGRRQRFRHTFFGALLTALFWRGSAAVYTVFLQRSMARYSHVYGGLAGAVMLLLWLYACMYCWLLGAECNRLLMQWDNRSGKQKMS